MLFISGQIPIDPVTGRLVEGDFREQVVRVMENLRAILEAAGFSLEHVVWVMVALKDLGRFREFNEVYSRYFPRDPPARITVGVCDLPAGALVEVSAIAVRPRG
jgi:2-iminobutanoate/2-iminopropanoate deaminase